MLSEVWDEIIHPFPNNKWGHRWRLVNDVILQFIMNDVFFMLGLRLSFKI